MKKYKINWLVMVRNLALVTWVASLILANVQLNTL